MLILSPLTGRPSVIVESRMAAARIINLYREMYHLDVSKYFADCPEVSICRDHETGYRFYWPPTLGGDGAFYAQLQRFEWYYMSGKWEHEQALACIRPGVRVLELGAGSGAFLERLRARGASGVGLEINAQAAATARAGGLDVRSEDLAMHARQCAGEYDVTCAFQVLEHLAEPTDFLRSLVQLLRPGGRLILSVPNNDSFLKWDRRGVLNMPPHHMGLWNRKSLLALAGLFDVSVERILLEPLQPYHYAWYLGVVRQRRRRIWGRLGKSLNGMLGGFDARRLRWFGARKPGHSIMVVYRKQGLEATQSPQAAEVGGRRSEDGKRKAGFRSPISDLRLPASDISPSPAWPS